jgi:SepF-like predicted cell division protein (DUF552 family)
MDEKLKTLLEDATDNILKEMKKSRISKKKVYEELAKMLKKKTSPKKKKKTVKIARVAFYVSDSSD